MSEKLGEVEDSDESLLADVHLGEALLGAVCKGSHLLNDQALRLF